MVQLLKLIFDDRARAHRSSALESVFPSQTTITPWQPHFLVPCVFSISDDFLAIIVFNFSLIGLVSGSEGSLGFG